LHFWFGRNDRLGAACDFRIVGLESDRLVEWILEQQLPFDSLYYYGGDSPSKTLRVGEASPKDLRPIHISYGPQQKRDIWAFTSKGVPTRKGIKTWLLTENKSK
jgi:hypothetical protein